MSHPSVPPQPYVQPGNKGKQGKAALLAPFSSGKPHTPLFKFLPFFFLAQSCNVLYSQENTVPATLRCQALGWLPCLQPSHPGSWRCLFPSQKHR